MAQVETRHKTEHVELDPFDPASLHAEQAPQIRFEAGSAVGQPT
jgi:hypothetical protein